MTDLTQLKTTLKKKGLSFKDSKKRYRIDPDDKPKILEASHECHFGISDRHDITLAHTAYWELFDERK